MNFTIASGKFDPLKGKVKQSIGEALGDDLIADSGVVDQVKGAAKEAWGNTKDALHSVAERVKSSAASVRAEAVEQTTAVRAEASAHDVRARLISTAQNVKDAVSTKAQQNLQPPAR